LPGEADFLVDTFNYVSPGIGSDSLFAMHLRKGMNDWFNSCDVYNTALPFIGLGNFKFSMDTLMVCDRFGKSLLVRE
jgi:hypothetical protein